MLSQFQLSGNRKTNTTMHLQQNMCDFLQNQQEKRIQPNHAQALSQSEITLPLILTCSLTTLNHALPARTCTKPLVTSSTITTLAPVMDTELITSTQSRESGNALSVSQQHLVCCVWYLLTPSSMYLQTSVSTEVQMLTRIKLHVIVIACSNWCEVTFCFTACSRMQVKPVFHIFADIPN